MFRIEFFLDFCIVSAMLLICAGLMIAFFGIFKIYGFPVLGAFVFGILFSTFFKSFKKLKGR